MTFTLRVADIAMRVVSDDPHLELTIPPVARPFLTADGAADVSIRVARAPALSDPRGEQLFDSGMVWRLYRSDPGFVFTFKSDLFGPHPYRIAEFDASFADGVLLLNREYLPAVTAVDPFEFPLPELLMTNLLARGTGVEIHGCGVVDHDDTGYLFAGPSGAGKSTMARFWAEQRATILSDDRVVLRLRDGRLVMSGTPWHGEDAFASPVSASLSRIFFLEHGLENRVRRLDPVRTVSRLFACSFPPFYDHQAVRFTLDVLSEIAGGVPCAELAFRPGADVVDFVRSGA